MSIYKKGHKQAKPLLTKEQKIQRKARKEHIGKIKAYEKEEYRLEKHDHRAVMRHIKFTERFEKRRQEERERIEKESILNRIPSSFKEAEEMGILK